MAQKNEDFTSIQFGSREIYEQAHRLKIKKRNRISAPIPGEYCKNYLGKFLSGEIPCECWQIAVKREFYIKEK